MTSYLLFLIPPEVLLEAIDFLDYRSLSVCRQVCRHLKGIIDTTSTCQYKFDLATAGLEGGLCDDGKLTGRHDALKQYQSGWDQLKWAMESKVTKQGGSLWELYGGVLAQSTAQQSFTFTRLPAVARGIEAKSWTVPKQSFKVRDFGMDPSQDLLVLVERAKWNAARAETTHRVHLLSLKKAPGSPHPMAQGGILMHIQSFRDRELSCIIQVSGDFIGLLFNTINAGQNELVVWNWKSGELKLDLTGDELQSFAFLSEKHILLCIHYPAAVEDENVTETVAPTLVVLDFHRQSDKPRNVLSLEAGAHFHYPRFLEDVAVRSFQVRSDPAPAWRPANLPFHLSKNNRLYIVTMWLQIPRGIVCLLLFVPSGTLLSKVDGMHMDDADIRNFPWEEWGPAGTRMMLSPHPHSLVWVCYVYGSRYVALEAPQDSDKNVWCRVYDFNVRPVRRGLLDVKEVVEPGPISREKSVQVVHQIGPMLIPSGVLFEDNVETWLPFRWKSVELDIPAGTRECAAMCSGDNLIIVEGDSKRYRILTF